MELDITRFFSEAAPRDYSASVAEIGNDAGRVTWRAALDDAGDFNLLPDDDARDAFKEYARGFGAWSADEIAAWSADELNALCMQFIAGDMRDYCDDAASWNWDEYEQGAQAGTYSGRLFRGDGGRVYYDIGS